MQVFIESEFRALRENHAHMHADNVKANKDFVIELAKVTAQTTATNGRVLKMEVAVAVLKFAVFTIGGGLLVAGLQIWIAKFMAAAQ